MNHRESQLQCACVKYFDYQYPKYRQLLFAIPNGGARSKTEAAIMKGEGVRPGVADMFLAMRSIGNGAGLFIEFKVGKNAQSKEQCEFESKVIVQNFTYMVIRDFDSFRLLIGMWMQSHTSTSYK